MNNPILSQPVKMSKEVISRPVNWGRPVVISEPIKWTKN